MAFKNMMSNFISYCADNIVPAATAQEKLAEAERRGHTR